MNPGIGNKSIGSGITESRTRGGARVYWRIRESPLEILAFLVKTTSKKSSTRFCNVLEANKKWTNLIQLFRATAIN